MAQPSPAAGSAWVSEEMRRAASAVAARVGVGVEERGRGGPHQRTVAGGRYLLLEVYEAGRLLPAQPGAQDPAGSGRRRRVARRAASR